MVASDLATKGTWASAAVLGIDLVEFKLTKDIPYHTLMGKLWGIYNEDYRENWSCCNITTL